MQNILLSLLFFYLAYVVVTLIGVLHTIFNVKVLHMLSMKESKGMGDAYENTKKFHPLYNIIVFPIFALLYLNSINDSSLMEALLTGLFWAIIAIIIDLVGWVLIKHPYSLTFKQFYIEYQPWITIIYIVIFISPIISLILCK